MKNRYTVVTTVISATFPGLAGQGVAHHGPIAEPLYDTSELVELQGEVTGVFWRKLLGQE